MHERQNRNGFDALDIATTAAGIAISLAMRVPAPLKPIADQVMLIEPWVIDPGSAHPRFLDPPASWRFLRPSRQENPGRSSGALAIPQAPVGFTDDHFPSQSTTETATGHAENTAHRGVPGTPLCRDNPPATRPHPHNGAAGQPPRQSVPVHLSTPRGRPPACHRRGRSPSIVLLATAPMVRRWVAGGGPEGRCSRTPWLR